MIHRNHLLCAVLSVGLLFSGCAVQMKKQAPDRTAGLAEAYIESGGYHEASGDLIAALREFNLALTAAPGNSEALKYRDRLQAEIRSSARTHYKKGVALEKKGRYSRARKEFLTALRLCPDFEEARKKLAPRKPVKIKGYINHRVREGDTLSKLAALYYGDYRKFPLIARYNNIDDATSLRVGQNIKIPGIGEAKRAKPQKNQEKETPAPGSDSNDWENVIAEAEDKGPSAGSILTLEKDEEEQVAIYRESGVELFNEGKYDKAIVELDKVLSSSPEDKAAQEYLHRCYFQKALSLYEQKKYLAARDQFNMSLRYKKDCRQCHRYASECEESFLKDHYRRGMQYYNNERPREAIVEWELVRKENPDYKRVNYLINKARTILNKLDQLKKEGQAGQ